MNKTEKGIKKGRTTSCLKKYTMVAPPRCSGCGNLTTLCACQPVGDAQETIQMGPGRPVYTVHTTNAPQETEPDFKRILLEFVKDVDAAGGVFEFEGTGVYGPVADKDWTDLADTYIKACKALRRRPHIVMEDA